MVVYPYMVQPINRQALGNTFSHTPLRIIALRVTRICAASLRTHQNAAFAAATEPNRPPRTSE